MQDFVNCLNEAYIASEDNSLGENFVLANWCDTWFTSSGINTLEPIVETENGELRSLKIM